MMAFFDGPTEILSFSSALLLLLLNSHRALEQTVHMDTDRDSEISPDLWYDAGHMSSTDVEHITTAALHNFRMYNVFSFFNEDLGYWVKPRSTIWFSRFLLEQYSEDRWIQMFRMSKRAVFALTDLLRPHIQKQDTKYQFAIPVFVRVAVTLFKLTHGVCSWEEYVFNNFERHYPCN
jgi:hypothetical protein